MRCTCFYIRATTHQSYQTRYACNVCTLPHTSARSYFNYNVHSRHPVLKLNQEISNCCETRMTWHDMKKWVSTSWHSIVLLQLPSQHEEALGNFQRPNQFASRSRSILDRIRHQTQRSATSALSGARLVLVPVSATRCHTRAFCRDPPGGICIILCC